MKINISDLLVLACIGIVLLILDRVYRINFRLEMFTNPIMCGVDKEPCAFGKKCMNGFCMSDTMPNLPSKQLPVFP